MAPDTNTTRILARIVGPFLALIGAAVLYRRQGMMALLDGLELDAPLVFVLGLFTAVIGVVMIAFHTRWRSPVAVVLTLLGWLTALRGALLLFAPGVVFQVIDRARVSTLPIRIGGLVALLLGLWLAFEGYFRKSASV